MCVVAITNTILGLKSIFASKEREERKKNVLVFLLSYSGSSRLKSARSMRDSWRSSRASSKASLPALDGDRFGEGRRFFLMEAVFLRADAALERNLGEGCLGRGLRVVVSGLRACVWVLVRPMRRGGFSLREERRRSRSLVLALPLEVEVVGVVGSWPGGSSGESGGGPEGWA